MYKRFGFMLNKGSAGISRRRLRPLMTFSDEVVRLRLVLLDRVVSPGVSFLECLLQLRDLEDFDDLEDRAGVIGRASGAKVDGPG
ncbi:hypothetical protein OUZ56_016214 [Daphnia magna]|uniref:Uncharacterized protein n=1 Tax=Daphnia magna TaxID=35525 RepID=A0ABR0AQ01_9CRUS|nr:hypothetical protein OUZ56_016214 [Daphnia magna]